MSNLKQPGNPVPAQPKKRRSGVPAIWKYEEAVFDLTALRAAFSGKTIPADIQQKIDRLDAEVKQGASKRKYKRQRAANNISCGRTSVMFFLKNPALIPVMAREQNRRRQLEDAGEDLTYLELDNESLCRHCWDRATFIFTQDESCGKDFSYDFRYRRIRTNYIYTMGRASRSVQMALREVARVQNEISNSKAQDTPAVPQVSAPTSPVPPPKTAKSFTTPIQEPSVELSEQEELAREEALAAYGRHEKQKAAAQKRRASMADQKLWAEQKELAQTLRNKCNDDFETEETVASDDIKPTISAVKEEPQTKPQETLPPLDMKPMFEESIFHDPEEAEKMSLPAATPAIPTANAEPKADPLPTSEPVPPKKVIVCYLPGFEMLAPTVVVGRKARKIRTQGTQLQRSSGREKE